MVVLLAMASGVAAQDPLKPVPALPSQESPPGVLWTMALAAPPAMPPVIAGDHVFVTTLPGVLGAYSLKDHRELWRHTIVLDQPVAAEGDRVYVASGDALHALNAADHKTVWRAPTGAITAPLLVKDGWIVAASATRLYALRASDGEVIWSCDSGPLSARPAISGDLLFVPLASRSLRAHDLRTGAVRWDRRFEGSPAEPLIVGDDLYVGVSDKRFYSLKTKDGENDLPPIRVGTLVRTRPASDGERVFFVALDNIVRAVRRQGGSQAWLTPVSFRPFDGPQIIGSVLAVAGPTRDVRLLNLAGGVDTGKVSFPEPLALAPAFGVLDGQPVVAGISGGLSAAWKLWLVTIK